MRFVLALLVLALAVPARAAGPEPALVAAVKTGDIAAVRTLLNSKVDINATEVDGTSALHWAVRAGDLSTTELLIRAAPASMPPIATA